MLTSRYCVNGMSAYIRDMSLGLCYNIPKSAEERKCQRGDLHDHVAVLAARVT